MRWFMISVLFAGVALLAGCHDAGTPSSTGQQTSLLLFHYDPAREIVTASTVPLTTRGLPTAQQYADALAAQPGASYAPSANMLLADPLATVTDDTVTVDYRQVENLTAISNEQTTIVLAVLEAWWWVPGVRDVRLQAKGEPLTVLGPVTLTQPLARAFRTFVLQPETGEVGYQVGSLTPKTPAEALTILQGREIRQFPATRGFHSLLPAEATITAAFDKVANGMLPVSLTGAFPSSDHARLAAFVLNFTQFQEISTVRFTFAGAPVNDPFMRSNLNAAIAPRDLLLPTEVALPATDAEATAVKTAITTALGKEPASLGTPLIWREWARVLVTPAAGAEPLTYLLRETDGAYTVQASGTNLSVTPDLLHKVSREALIPLRVPGWEALAE